MTVPDEHLAALDEATTPQLDFPADALHAFLGGVSPTEFAGGICPGAALSPRGNQ